ncbi:putative clathrin assembly protein At1g33340 [Papaver somniferum]|uniref:putative clathrin assembly protein At1g33340 n=1 Tax=Papaver somniferum TaxID=3469 RepID=UPI000E6FA946|nr:putative clathrin assembly protein At1g33340 [Papaver somniferum]
MMDVQSKLRLVLGSVKDQASISKAMIYRKDGYLSDIEIAILRATSHDEHPIDDKQLHEILFLVSNSSPSSISIPYLSQKISNRLRKTKNHFVALKMLLLVHRLLRGGDRKFEQGFRKSHLNGHLEILSQHHHHHNHHHHHLNHYYFLHNYASFIEERMSWFMNQAGKLEPQYDKITTEIRLCGLPKLQLFLDQVLNCSSVLDIISPSDSLTRAALHNILKETSQVYNNFCDEVAILANSFFDLKDHAVQVQALKLLKKACRQSSELSDFFQKYNRVVGSTSMKLALKFPTTKIITIDHVLVMEQYVNDNNMGEVSSSVSIVDDDKSVASREDSEVPEELTIGTSSTTFLFSCKLETRISTEWVLFDD